MRQINNAWKIFTCVKALTVLSALKADDDCMFKWLIRANIGELAALMAWFGEPRMAMISLLPLVHVESYVLYAICLGIVFLRSPRMPLKMHGLAALMPPLLVAQNWRLAYKLRGLLIFLVGGHALFFTENALPAQTVHQLSG
jgi:hypothetical protein